MTSCSQSTQSGNSDYQADKHRTTPSKIELKSEKGKSARFECINHDFNSTKEQADSLLAFMERAASSDSSTRQKWEKIFFCAFPNSFEGMQAVFGFDREKGAAPLYSNGAKVIQYFNQIESIPDSIYYDKYVNININGIWEADNIREAFGIHHRLLNDTKGVCSVLSQFDNKEIESVFRFIFDGPHPKNDYNEYLYKQLKPILNKQDKRLGRLLTQAYDKLIVEDDGHGH